MFGELSIFLVRQNLACVKAGFFRSFKFFGSATLRNLIGAQCRSCAARRTRPARLRAGCASGSCWAARRERGRTVAAGTGTVRLREDPDLTVRPAREEPPGAHRGRAMGRPGRPRMPSCGGGGSCRGLRRAQAVSSPTPHAEGCRATVCRPSSAGGAGPDTPASGSGQRQPRSQGRLSRDGRPSCGSHRLLRPGLLRSSLKGSWSGSVGRWSAGAATPRRPGRRPRSSSRRRRAWRPDVREPRGADRRGVWCGLWRARRRS